MLDALEASKLSIAEFARQEGIDPQRLYLWRRKLGSSRVAHAPPAGTHLVELRVRQPSHGASLGMEVACPSGHVVRVRDSASVDALAAVRRAIEGASC